MISFIKKLKTFFLKRQEEFLGIVDIKEKQLSSGDDKLVGELIELLIKLRTEAKQNKNYQLSDTIRDRLKDLGVVLQDGKEGTSYKISG